MAEGDVDKLLVRPARLIDLDHVVRLWAVLMEHHGSLGDRLYELEPHAQATWRAWARRKMDDVDGILLVAELGGRIVNGHGADTDIVIASAKAYLVALNKLSYTEERFHPQLSGGI